MPSALPLDPPQRLVRSLGSQHGHAGEQLGRAGQTWLDGLPALLERALERWELKLERVVSPGRQEQPGVAGAAGGRLARRAEAARSVSRRGCGSGPRGSGRRSRAGTAGVRCSCCGPHVEDGALLLERLHGEMSLRSLPEAKAMLEAASAARRLWVARRATRTARRRHRHGRRAHGGQRRVPALVRRRRRCGRCGTRRWSCARRCCPSRPKRCCCTATSGRARCSPRTPSVRRGSPPDPIR